MNIAFKHCKDCTARYPGCHGNCEHYKQDAEHWRQIKEHLNSDKEGRAYKNHRTYKHLDKQAKQRRRRPHDVVK